ncbi:MAG: peptide chain release factor N(5)-glutamine methyltransferase [Planctomycetes bacterium]|nr:peptide chain release factor N(5)-glutamine methyltransferase [Planctomycetota bacterium]
MQRRNERPTVWTVQELLQWTADYFQRLGLPSARLDAEVLLAEALGKRRIELYTGYHMLVEPEERARFRAFVERRARREPVAYITGRREFYSLSFEVSPAVLVPRPETEHVVDAALARLKAPRPEGSASGPRRALDLGTGSGCIAVAIAANAPEVEVDAVDLSPEALAVARRNAEAHGVAARVRLHEGDLFAAVPPGAGPHEVIASNPPYISAAEYERLMDDVRLHEPRAALLDLKSPASDGLGSYRVIAAEAPARLEPGGLLAVEVGMGQAAAVRAILVAAGLVLGETLRDYGGIERVVTALRRP